MKKSLLLSLVGAGSICGQTLDVFFLAGQSNADGSNSLYFDNGDPSKGGGLSSENAFYADPYGGITYAYAHVNPFGGSADRYLTGVPGDLRPATWGMMGPELSLGRRLDELHANDVALIKYTAPGTSLANQWGPDDNLLYQDMVDFFNTNLATISLGYSEVRLNTFFWHQGESDSGATYESDFTAMFSQLRVDLGAPDLTAVLGLISEDFDPGSTGPVPRPSIMAVNAAILSMSSTYDYITNTGSLTDIPLHDNVHFDANGQVIHGLRMADAYEANFLTVPEPSAGVLLLAGGLALVARRR